MLLLGAVVVDVVEEEGILHAVDGGVAPRAVRPLCPGELQLAVADDLVLMFSRDHAAASAAGRRSGVREGQLVFGGSRPSPGAGVLLVVPSRGGGALHWL